MLLGGKVTLAKDAAVTLSGGSYTSSASIFGPNRIEGGTFYGAVALQDGSSVSSGSFIGAVTISDTVTVTGGTFTGDVTINHGGKLVASAGTFGSVTVQSGGGGALTGGHFGEITQIDGTPAPPFWRRAAPIPTAASSTAMSPSSVAWTWSTMPSTSTSG